MNHEIYLLLFRISLLFATVSRNGYRRRYNLFEGTGGAYLSG